MPLVIWASSVIRRSRPRWRVHDEASTDAISVELLTEVGQLVVECGPDLALDVVRVERPEKGVRVRAKAWLFGAKAVLMRASMTIRRKIHATFLCRWNVPSVAV